jgi:hypothetical protein
MILEIRACDRSSVLKNEEGVFSCDSWLLLVFAMIRRETCRSLLHAKNLEESIDQQAEQKDQVGDQKIERETDQRGHLNSRHTPPRILPSTFLDPTALSFQL